MRLLAIVLLFAAGASPLAAQDHKDDAAPSRWEIGPYVGVARHSLVGHHLGMIPDRDHLFIGIHITAALWRTPRFTFAYAPDLVPLLIVTNNPTYKTFTPPGVPPITVEDGSGPVAGFGGSPIGFEGQLAVGSRWRAYAAGAAGALWFTRDVPVIESRRFNYTFEVGGGIAWQMRPRTSLRFGYKFHHLSNGYSAPQNPGIDGAVFLVGVGRRL